MSTLVQSLFLLFLPLSYQVSSIETCLTGACQMNQLKIQFPFRIRGQQPKTCGYPGFSVSCSKEGQTLIKLPYSGEFSIQGIDYSLQELWVNDPDDCLPKRILSLNLSGSPFDAVYYQEFVFFNCSGDYGSYRFNPIACLSGSNYTVFASSSIRVAMHLLAVCNLIRRVKVPVQWPFYDEILSSVKSLFTVTVTGS